MIMIFTNGRLFVVCLTMLTQNYLMIGTFVHDSDIYKWVSLICIVSLKVVM